MPNPTVAELGHSGRAPGAISERIRNDMDELSGRRIKSDFEELKDERVDCVSVRLAGSDSSEAP